ncbi:hypothetical protein GCM10025777_00400 [Membranihabitans marinus]
MIMMISFSCNSKSPEGGKVVSKVEEKEPTIGVALYSFKNFPFFTTLEKSKAVGAEYVEGFFFHKLGEDFENKTMLQLSDAELAKLKTAIERAGLVMPSVYAGGKTEQEWRRFFEIGERLDLDFLTCEPEPEYWDLLNQLGEEKDIRIAIHEHAKGKSRFWHPDSVLLAIEGRPQFGACADLGHWVRSGLDPVQCLKKLEGHIIGVHAKDIDVFNKLDALDVKIGDGVIDYPAVMEELARQGFGGPIYIECEHDWEDNHGDVAFGIEYLRKL